MAITLLRMRYRVANDPDVAVEILDMGLACCAAELGSAITAGLLEPATEPGAVRVLVVSGTVTQVLAPAVERAFQALEEPKAVLAFGACAISGGPYWDSPTVLPGIDQRIPVAVYTPGCPPQPEALIAGIRELARTWVPA